MVRFMLRFRANDYIYGLKLNNRDKFKDVLKANILFNIYIISTDTF